MELSRTIATMAVVLGVILAAGYAQGESGATKQAFERACNRPLKTDLDFDLCRTAYKRLQVK
jgi:hypothetical protein